MWFLIQIAFIGLWYVPAFAAVPALVIFAPTILWVFWMVVVALLFVIHVISR